MQLDHIQPRALGGPTLPENLRVAHKRCNIVAGRKARTEREARLRNGLPVPLELPVTIRFPASLRKRALGVAQDEDRTFASLVIYALRRYVDQAEPRRGQ
jgi:hypothetical protein